MKKPPRSQTLIAVNDVKKSSAWYRKLLDARATSVDMQSDHDHIYDRIYQGDSLLLQLHCWDEEEHPNLMRDGTTKAGHGVLLWYEVDDFDAAVARAKELGAEIVRDVHRNPPPAHWELWLRDPDGYTVVIVSPDGSAP